MKLKMIKIDDLLLTKEDATNINKLSEIIKITEEKVQKVREETVKQLTMEQNLNGDELEESNDKYEKLIRIKYQNKGRVDEIVIGICLFLVGLIGIIWGTQLKWLSFLVATLGAVSTYLGIKWSIINRKVKKNLKEFDS